VRFANEVSGASATISMNGAQVANLQAGETSNYVQSSSGSKNIAATYSAGSNVEEPVFLETDLKITVRIVEDTLGVRSFVKVVDGTIYE
jgi:hypothetical protein